MVFNMDLNKDDILLLNPTSKVLNSGVSITCLAISSICLLYGVTSGVEDIHQLITLKLVKV